MNDNASTIVRACMLVAGLVASYSAPQAATVPGQALSEAQVTSGKQALDPSMGYILIRGGGTGTFLREPDDATRAAWNHDREQALAKAKKKYVSELALWEADVEARKKSSSKDNLPPKPVEPNLDTVVVNPLGVRDMVTYGPQGRYTKTQGTTYLTAVKPGTYYWAGMPLFPGGSCMCMGTVQFKVKPGAVTNLGNMIGSYTHMNYDLTVPESLKGWPVETAQLQAHGKFDNFFAAIVSRLAPIPGVLSYRRDTVIDERTGQALPNPKLVSMQKPKL